MNRFTLFLFLAISFFLQSCEFNCSVGNKEIGKESVTAKENTRIKNEISLQTDGVKVDKAYLLFEDGETVPDDNIVDFSQPIQLVLVIDKGWQEENNKVSLGASEKIEAEKEVLLDEKDLFENKFPEGMPAEDAKIIYLKAKITLKKRIQPLTTFIVSFHVWDKKGKGFIQGNYKLYSK